VTKARLIITAVVIEGRTQAEVADGYGVSRGWVSKLVTRYRAEGEAAFVPRSRRPGKSPTALPEATVRLIIELREKLTAAGLDAGPDTIAWHLTRHHTLVVSVSTISRYLTRAGRVTAQPKKRPKSSYIRFQAELPNQTWQSDFTHYRLTRPEGIPGADVEILTWLDDCSRFALAITAHPRVTGPIVLASFRTTIAAHGIPASTLTDNGLVYTARFAGGRGGRTGLEHELPRPRRGPKELPPEPPNHLRQSRTLPTDHEELAARATRPAHHDRGTPDPPGPVRRRVQPPPPTPLATAPSDPGDHLHHPAQGTPGHQPRHRHPRPRSPRPR
jgi:transposase